MKEHIDELTIELAKSFRHSSMMGLPPKLRYRLRRWLQTLSPTQQKQQVNRQAMMNTIKSELVSKLLGAMEDTKLAKNEMMASAYNDGSIKLDFGCEVPEAVKKAALSWATKRGLKPVESSMKKSEDEIETVVLKPKEVNEVELFSCVQKIKYTIN